MMNYCFTPCQAKVFGFWNNAENLRSVRVFYNHIWHYYFQLISRQGSNRMHETSPVILCWRWVSICTPWSQMQVSRPIIDSIEYLAMHCSADYLNRMNMTINHITTIITKITWIKTVLTIFFMGIITQQCWRTQTTVQLRLCNSDLN